MVDPVITKVLGFVILLSSLFQAYYRYAARRDGTASLGWPSVMGEIVRSKTTEGYPHSGQPPSGVTIYKYSVDGKSHRGQDVTLLAHAYEKHEYAQRYEAGQEVKVYYKPGKPSRSVLIPGSENQFADDETGAQLFWITQIALIAVGTGIFAWAMTAKPW